MYPRQNIRQTPEPHRHTAGITPGLRFLPTPRSQPEPDSLVNPVQGKLAEAPRAQELASPLTGVSRLPFWDDSKPREQGPALLRLEKAQNCQVKLLTSKGKELGRMCKERPEVNTQGR